MNTRCVSAKCFSLTHTESQEDSAVVSTLQLFFEKHARRGYQPDQACLFPGDRLLKQGDLAGVRHARESAQRLQLLDMGLGKTITPLTAINNLIYDLFEVRKVLIIAPLRVARDTWSAEVQKWDHLKHLRYSVAVGTAEERIAALKANADIYIINRENVDWLVINTTFDYDMVVIDELSSFKNHQSKRFKALMKVRPKVKRIVGLTGTPASNGLMDLFAEFRLLDMGQRLGRFIGQYRNEYFKPDKQNGYIVYSYKPLPDAEERIYEKISDITVSMKAIDHLKMPELISNEYIVKMSDAEKEKY